MLAKSPKNLKISEEYSNNFTTTLSVLQGQVSTFY